jgi:hypothetical protein
MVMSQFRKNNRSYLSSMVNNIVSGQLVFRPAPPGDIGPSGKTGLILSKREQKIDVTDEEVGTIKKCIANGLPSSDTVTIATEDLNDEAEFADVLKETGKHRPKKLSWAKQLDREHQLDELALMAMRIIDRSLEPLLKVEPLEEIHFSYSKNARFCLAIAWLALVERGLFPLPPLGYKRFEERESNPCGAMHFVSASDVDDGYFYTIGIALSPEAQALETMDGSFGLDGELIVPGQAVSPIPPFLAMATRLFAASIPTSSNISEEVHSIPMRNFPHPSHVLDLEPRRGGTHYQTCRPTNLDEAVTDLKIQLNRYQNTQSVSKQSGDFQNGLPKVGAVFDVTGLSRGEIVYWMKGILDDGVLNQNKRLVALYLNVEHTPSDRVGTINSVVDIAADFGLKYVAVTDEVEDPMLPDLLEYLTPDELNDVADNSDARGVIVIDGRPIDPVYTASTAAQRIQSVYSTLSVDILKMGMWLCLDAMNARSVWTNILNNPHVPRKMLLMPIGIVEPWNAFVDNRNPDKTSRPISDPFKKIQFMIEEAKLLKMPSLLTDTRHKEKWVLLGMKSPSDEAHARERFIRDQRNGTILGRTNDSVIPLLTWEEFMECERLARKEGILLGQAGSIEGEQVFKIISETTYDAAKEGKNPATAIWTAETERVLRTGAIIASDLQQERSAAVSPFLAIINRGNESHAKLDGWLRFLADLNRSDRYDGKLKIELDDERKNLSGLLNSLLENQMVWKKSERASDLSKYQKTWENYRREYVRYHLLIKDNFRKVRDLVSSEWNLMENHK